MVPSPVDAFSLEFCRLSPQEKHHIPLFAVQGTYCSVCELFPALLGMRVCLMGSHSKTDIQEQHALLCPLQEKALCEQNVSKLCLTLQCNVLK